MTRHPGGLRLTARAVRLASLGKGARILDVGCGDGDTVRYLQEQGFYAKGIDHSAEKLPFESEGFDCVTLECVLSILEDAGAALREARRVLRSNGRLLVSDVFAGSPYALRWQLVSAGFQIDIEENHTPALVTYAAELRLRSAEPDYCPSCLAEGGRPGYVLFVCTRK